MNSRRWMASAILAVGCASEPTDGASAAASSGRTSATPASSATIEAGASASTTPSAAPPRAAALDVLERAIDTQYAYRDRLGLDWRALFATARARAASVTTRDEFVRVLVELLAHARDAHMDLIVDGKYVPTDPARPVPNVSLAGIQSRVTDWKNLGRCLSVGRVRKLAYVLVNSLENGRCDSLPTDWSKALPEVEAAPGMILDLRGNSGGNEVYGQAIAGSFVASATPYVMSEPRDAAAPSGFLPRVTRTLKPAQGRRYAGRVVVLIGPLNMSSAESFALMMRAAGAKLFGSTTRGASANPKLVDLGDGISVRVASWRALFLDGTLLEGHGVVPDREISVTPEEIASGDPFLDAAAAELELPR